MPKLRRVALMLELNWPFDRHRVVFVGTQRYAQECGRWQCVIDEITDETLRTSRKGFPPYDGVISRAPVRLAEESRRCGVPLVNVWYSSPAKGAPAVYPDFAAAGRLAAEHLLGLGLRQFACLSASRERAFVLMASAFQAEVRAAGCNSQVINIPWQTAPRGTASWLRFQEVLGRSIESWTPPIGVYVALNDMTARHVVIQCSNRGLRVPEDVALVAGINEPMLCLHPAPSLTSIAIPYEEIGYQAAKMLDALMDGRRPPAEPLLLPPVGLAARQSTNCLAVEDPTVAAALQFLVANSHRKIGVPELAAAIHTSRRTLERRFVATIGRTPAQEIRRLRIERAKRHLTDSNVPIKTVAHMVGFANGQQLYDAFRQYEGMSPAQYRAARGVGRRPG
jgi:LacI family transcriptional regulator